MVNNLFLSCVVTTNTASFLPVPHLAPLMGVARARQQRQLMENCLGTIPNNTIIFSPSNLSFCRVTVEDLSIVLKEIVGSLGESRVGQEKGAPPICIQCLLVSAVTLTGSTRMSQVIQ